ncbi:hypothetical protein EV191_1307 [Tamaricihabitans halophyticus]|uniref:Uncharacterized protein n=1 Tax=Tamaricihabitans halophyticus TaxID=1262583 RepID=A0A4R2PTX5_9PSEU|nr:hypothetical protein [Tamaricihabitans halophyticus]TCP39359.1 hypothetical protein EV191_1307 [Tamaricihabitans halophyticus]
MPQGHPSPPAWQEAIFTALKKSGAAIHDVVLTAEEEGVTVAADAWWTALRGVDISSVSEEA